MLSACTTLPLSTISFFSETFSRTIKLAFLFMCLCYRQLEGENEGSFTLTLMDGSCTLAKLDWTLLFATGNGPFSLSLSLDPSSRCAGERRSCGIPHGEGYTFCPRRQGGKGSDQQVEPQCFIHSCDPGYTLVSREGNFRQGCEPCPEGTFKEGAGIHQCTPCPLPEMDDKSSFGSNMVPIKKLGAKSIQEGCSWECAAGYSSIVNGKRSPHCLPCRPGFYKKGPGPAPCRRCSNAPMSAFYTGLAATSHDCPFVTLGMVLSYTGTGHWWMFSLGIAVGVVGVLAAWKMLACWSARKRRGGPLLRLPRVGGIGYPSTDSVGAQKRTL